jgi:hypothetical protein
MTNLQDIKDLLEEHRGCNRDENGLAGGCALWLDLNELLEQTPHDNTAADVAAPAANSRQSWFPHTRDTCYGRGDNRCILSECACTCHNT